MEEKKKGGSKVPIVLVILELIVIIVMGVLLYKTDESRKAEAKKATELQVQLDEVNKIANGYQEKIDQVSEALKEGATTIQQMAEEAAKVNYEFSVRDSVYVSITATKDGKTVTKEVKMDGPIANTGTIEMPSIGKVAVVSCTNGDYYGAKVYQLINDQLEELGTIDGGSAKIPGATYEVSTKNENTVVIKATKDGKTETKEFKVDNKVAKAEVVDVPEYGKMVVVAEDAGSYYTLTAFRLDNSGIVQAGTIKCNIK